MVSKASTNAKPLSMTEVKQIIESFNVKQATMFNSGYFGSSNEAGNERRQETLNYINTFN